MIEVCLDVLSVHAQSGGLFLGWNAVLIHLQHLVAAQMEKEQQTTEYLPTHRLLFCPIQHTQVPRGALMAGSLAQTAEFFSFGSNDLTQLVCCAHHFVNILGHSRV